MESGANDNRRFGGGTKWWTCQLCKTKRGRIPMDSVKPDPNQVPKDNDILNNQLQMMDAGEETQYPPKWDDLGADAEEL